MKIKELNDDTVEVQLKQVSDVLQSKDIIKTREKEEQSHGSLRVIPVTLVRIIAADVSMKLATAELDYEALK